VRGQIAVRKNVKLPFRLRRYCFHPHSRAVGYSTAFFIKTKDVRSQNSEGKNWSDGAVE
jgi:hypothetical protein